MQDGYKFRKIIAFVAAGLSLLATISSSGANMDITFVDQRLNILIHLDLNHSIYSPSLNIDEVKDCIA